MEAIANNRIDLLNRRAAGALRRLNGWCGSDIPLPTVSFRYSPYHNFVENPWHLHTHVEFQFVFAGQTVWHTVDRAIRVKAGGIMVMPPGTLHRRGHTADRAQAMGFHLNAGREALAELVRAVRASGHVVKSTKSLRGFARELTNLLRDDAPSWEPQAALVLGRLLYEAAELLLPPALLRRLQSNDNRRDTVEYHQQAYAAALKYIDDNLARSLSMAEIAANCYVSPRQLHRIFLKTCGVTPGRHMLRRRVDRSFALLGNPCLALAEIAARTGFSDAAHFLRAFKATTGLTPGQYRRRLDDAE